MLTPRRKRFWINDTPSWDTSSEVRIPYIFQEASCFHGSLSVHIEMSSLLITINLVIPAILEVLLEGNVLLETWAWCFDCFESYTFHFLLSPQPRVPFLGRSHTELDNSCVCYHSEQMCDPQSPPYPPPSRQEHTFLFCRMPRVV